MGRRIGILVASLWAATAHAQLSSTVDAVSDYDFRGISLSAWASNVDFGADYAADVEVDYYFDYEHALNETFALYAGISLYTYPSSDVDSSPEAYVGFGAGDFELRQWFTDDYSALGQTALYTELNYTAALSRSLALTLHAGYSYGDAFEDAELVDFAVGLDYTAGNFVVGAKLVGTDASGDLEVDEDAFNNQPRLLVSISTTLPWEGD
jgi:uncharacterized protein (TIGR02001 family)